MLQHAGAVSQPEALDMRSAAAASGSAPGGERQDLEGIAGDIEDGADRRGDRGQGRQLDPHHVGADDDHQLEGLDQPSARCRTCTSRRVPPPSAILRGRFPVLAGAAGP
ncbi:hypothetical protein D3093_33950 (plasmid) [Azospirillum argentinense]|uniref:Uncharacterized protein n=1 Tax=Azospirillum argentinense TaxID=2970906 RepID=A0A4D8PP32_9PROT|nr:hypothetical protein D3093_33950 [Azospirillum argentinense]